jgi:hypothetical protein
MDPEAWHWIPNAGNFLMSVFLAGVGAVWVFARMTGSLEQKLEEAKLEYERRVNAQCDLISRNFGETVSAVRQKINEMELFNRDHFVNTRTFDLVNDQTQQAIRRLEDKLEDRFNKIDDKLAKMAGDK